MFWIRIVYYIKIFTNERKGDCHLNNDSHTIVMIHKVAIIKNIKNRLKELSCPDLYLFFPRRPWLVCHTLFLFLIFFEGKLLLWFSWATRCAHLNFTVSSQRLLLCEMISKMKWHLYVIWQKWGPRQCWERWRFSDTEAEKSIWCLSLPLPGTVSPHRKVLRTLILRPEATARQASGGCPHKKFEPIVMEHPPSASRLPHSHSPNTQLCSLAVTDRKDLTK